MANNPTNEPDKPTVSKIELDELASTGSDNIVFDNNMQLIENVSVNLSVSIGKTHLSVKELFDLKEGELLILDKLTQEPVEIYLDGKVVARGELVAAGDNFGVRITEIKSS